MPKVVKIQEKKASKHLKIGRSHKKASKKQKITENGGKSFKYFYDLPAELRMMVVDEMEPIDRCRFSQCSFSSSMESKRSKNSIHSLEFHGLSGDQARIKVNYDEESNFEYFLLFQEDSGKKCMKYTNFQGDELWRTELPSSTDLVQFAAEHFKNMLRDYQNIIKWLKMYNSSENKLNNFDFGFRNLANLEELDIDINSNILSKLRKPLKRLVVFGEENSQGLEDYELSNISETICLPHLKLNYEKFIQLSAPTVLINIGEITEKDICKVITSWKTQPAENKAIRFEWILEGSKFDVSKLLKLLGSEKRYNPDAEEEELMKIKHGFEKGKEAVLSCYNTTLSLNANF